MPNRNTQDAILAKKYASAREINPKKRRVLRSKVRQLLSNAIREDHSSAELRYRFGYFLMDEGEYNKAFQYFEKALAVRIINQKPKPNNKTKSKSD